MKFLLCNRVYAVKSENSKFKYVLSMDEGRAKILNRSSAKKGKFFFFFFLSFGRAIYFLGGGGGGRGHLPKIGRVKGRRGGSREIYTPSPPLA